MELQGAIFKEIVSKLGHVDLLDENANKKYDLVLMEDIRNYIVKNAPSNLSTEYSVDVI
jgi:6-pyruvoyl-tetrahydropterin synthase